MNNVLTSTTSTNPTLQDDLRLLTLWQPHASFMGWGWKLIETRPGTITWHSYRGWVAIHAASKSTFMPTCEYLNGIFEGFPNDFDFTAGGGKDTVLAPVTYPYGAVLAIARIVDSFVMSPERIRQQTPLEIAVGDWRVGRIGVVTDNLIPLVHPVPAKGSQGLPRMQMELKELILNQLP